jgi:hypothetical protein
MDSDGRALQPPILRFASRPSDDADIRRFLGRRLLVHLRLMTMVFGGIYLSGVVGLALFFPRLLVPVHKHPAKIVNAILAVLLLVLWVWVRRREWSVAAMRTFDFAAHFLIALGIGFGVATAPVGFHFEMGGLLIYVFSLVLRAAFVPSGVPWTATVGLTCAIPVVVGAYIQTARGPVIDLVTPPMVAVIIGIWCILATGATTVVSRVIYGLVNQVREVMHLGRYTLVEQIGEGGMGTVYRAEHAMLRRPTAVKLLLPGRVSPEALARFEREVQLTSRLSHPNTVAIYDYGRTPDGVFYYAMEYLDGISLEQLVAHDGPQPESRVVHLLGQIAGALAEAHGIGLIHRDIKPANIMLCERGGMPDVAKVVDFGLVKRLGGTEPIALTSTNAITGTPLYMAPETITRPDNIDGRADLYALGAVGYFLLTGAPPFTGKSVVEICSHHLHTPAEPPSTRLGRPVLAKVEALVLACLAKAPEDRPRDALDVAARVAECEAAARWNPAEARAWWTRWREKNAPAQGHKHRLALTATVARDVA